MQPFHLISVLLGLFLIHSQPSIPPQDDGLIAYYSFNECNARDDSGNGSHGEIFGETRCWCGIEQEGLVLDGKNNYIEFPGPVNKYFNTSDFTISFYFKSEKYDVFPQSMLSKAEACDEYYTLDLLLDRRIGEVTSKVHETPARYYKDLSPRLDSSSWMHYALVREGFRAMTFINGQLRQESYRCSGVDIGNNAVLSFSNSPCVLSGRVRRFQGIIDELKIYDHALTIQEIEDLYLMNPVENANMDCVSFVPDKKAPQIVMINEKGSTFATVD
ncbi:MAG: LamG domain-containing protein [Saprospiraceae bacterium]|nr:LamG domain-containing protein [Saprospiraceae bacterium]MCB9324562.1 LamG domain-containing protein [Lewinellaceae bacterium]